MLVRFNFLCRPYQFYTSSVVPSVAKPKYPFDLPEKNIFRFDSSAVACPYAPQCNNIA